MRAWVNGRLLEDPAGAAISVTDHGLTVGDGVFETVKVVGGRPFALTRHLRRLATSALGLALEPPADDVVRRAVQEVLNDQDLPLGRVRITLTGGEAPPGSGRGDAGPTLVAVAGPMEPQPRTTAAITVPWPRNERGALAGLKTTSYAENVVALARAVESGATEALFGNTIGSICEGTGSNVFYVLDGELRTPTLASGCLAGITRELLLEWMPQVVQADAPMAMLERAEEVFLVSTTRDVQGLHRLDDRDLAAPGPVTRRAMEIWQEGERTSDDP